MNSDTSSSLLPSGFEDLLPPQADAEYRAISSLMSSFEAFGYQRVKPPMAEFEESLLAAGPGSTLSAETFRVMDPVTHRMMGLRSDITAQIARIAQSRLAEQERPLRLMYANDVIRTKASQVRSQRQFTQVGCELIGRDDVEGYVEICVVALKGLAALDIKGITIDFALPWIFDYVFQAADVPKTEIDSLRAQLAGPANKALDALDKLGLYEEAQWHVDDLRKVVQGVREALEAFGLSEVSLTVDPLETKGFEYHHGVAFTLFADGVRGEIGRGGSYLLYDKDDSKFSETAAGFTLYMDTLRQALPQKDQDEVKVVSKGTSWSEILELQNQGFIVRRG